MKTCPTCGQSYPLPMPAGVYLPATKLRIYEAIRRVGQNGISRDDLFEMVYGADENGGPEALSIIATHVNQINKKLKLAGEKIWCGRGNGSHQGGGGTYRLVKLP